MDQCSIVAQCWVSPLRFQVSLVTQVTNTSGVRLVGGKLDVAMAAPTSSQSFTVIRATPSPRIESKSEGNTHAITRIPALGTERAFESRMIIEYTVTARSFQLGEAATSPRPEHSTNEFCKHAKFWETKDPLVRRTAEKIRRSSNSTETFLSNAFSWVRDNVRLQEPQHIRLGASHAIRALSGDCDELSDLFIALCRSVGIASRRVVGIFYHGHASEGRPFEWHAWAEVSGGENVWIPFDPSLGFFASISERHIARCCMGRQSDCPVRRITWRSQPEKPPTLNDDDIEKIIALSS